MHPNRNDLWSNRTRPKNKRQLELHADAAEVLPVPVGITARESVQQLLKKGTVYRVHVYSTGQRGTMYNALHGHY